MHGLMCSITTLHVPRLCWHAQNQWKVPKLQWCCMQPSSLAILHLCMFVQLCGVLPGCDTYALTLMRKVRPHLQVTQLALQLQGCRLPFIDGLLSFSDGGKRLCMNNPWPRQAQVCALGWTKSTI